MAIRGAGENPREEFAKLIAPIEAQLRSLGEISTNTDLPKGKTQTRSAIGSLDYQIALVGNYARSPDPEVQKQATTLLGRLQAQRLRIEDPLLAAYVEKLLTKYQEPAADSAKRHLIHPELATVLALVGEHLSDAEFHAISLLEPLMTAEQKSSQVDPLLTSSHKAERARGEAFSAQRLWAETSMVAPVAVPLVATAALTALEVVTGPFAALISIGGAAVGMDVGKYLQLDAQMAVSDYGVNRIAGVAVDHELVRLHDRVEELRLPSDEDQARRKLADEAAVFRELLSVRTPAKGEFEEWVVRTFTWYADRLDYASKTPRPHQFLAETQRELLRVMSRSSLDQIPSRMPMPAALVDNDGSTAAAVDRLVREHNKVLLAMTHPSLFRLMDHLEGKYSIESRVGNLPAVPEHLSREEVKAIRTLVGKEPSLAEFIALHRVEQAGLLNVFEVWGEHLAVRLPDGSTLGGDNLKLLMEALGGRGQATALEQLGENLPRVVLYLSALGGIGLTLALASNPLGWLAAGGILIASRLTGFQVGRHLADLGREKKVLSGVEAAGGRPVLAEHALIFERLADPRELLQGSDAKLRTKLREEGQLIATLAASARTTVNKAEKMLASGQVGGSQLRDAVLALGQHLPLQNAIYSHVNRFATALQEIADSGADASTMRQRFFDARAKLFDPAVGYEVAKDLVTQQIVPEKPVEMASFGVRVEDFIDAVKVLVKSGAAPENYLALLQQARAVTDSKQMVPKKQRDVLKVPSDVQKLADLVVKDPYRSPDMALIKRVADGSEVAKAALNRSFEEAEPVSAERANKVAQELVNLLWTQIYPLFGTVPFDREGKIPRLTNLTAKKIDRPDQPIHFEVSGDVKRGGKFSIEVSAFGEPDIDTMKLDLGEGTLRQMAVAEMEKQAEALGVPIAYWQWDSATATQEKRPADSETYGVDHFYRVTVPNAFEIVMTPDGFALPDTFRKV